MAGTMKVLLIPLSSVASPIFSPSGSRFTAAGGSVSQRNSSSLRMASRPEEFNAAKFPPAPEKKWSEKKNKKNFERGLMLESTTISKGRSPRLQDHHPHFPVLTFQKYPSSLTAQRSLGARFLKISSNPWHFYPQVARRDGAAVWQRRTTTGRRQSIVSHEASKSSLCPCRSSFSFANSFPPSLRLSVFPAALIGGWDALRMCAPPTQPIKSWQEPPQSTKHNTNPGGDLWQDDITKS